MLTFCGIISKKTINISLLRELPHIPKCYIIHYYIASSARPLPWRSVASGWGGGSLVRCWRSRGCVYRWWRSVVWWRLVVLRRRLISCGSWRQGSSVHGRWLGVRGGLGVRRRRCIRGWRWAISFEVVDDLADVQQRPAFCRRHHTGAHKKCSHHHDRHGCCLQRHLHLSRIRRRKVAIAAIVLGLWADSGRKLRWWSMDLGFYIMMQVQINYTMCKLQRVSCAGGS